MALKLIMGISPDVGPAQVAEHEQHAKYATGIAYAGTLIT